MDSKYIDRHLCCRLDCLQCWRGRIIQISMNDKQQYKGLSLQRQANREDNKNGLKSKSNVSDSAQSSKAIDILRLLSKKQRSRQSKIAYGSFAPQNKREHAVRRSDFQVNVRVSSFSLNEDDQQYSTYGNKGPAVLREGNALDESFLSGNESSCLIGVLLYVLFMLFLSVEVVATAYVIPKVYSNNAFFLETALLTILLSQLAYYLLLRYISQHSSKRIFAHRSARTSFDKLMKLSKTGYYQGEEKSLVGWIIERPLLLLFTVSATVMVCQVLYSRLASQVIVFFSVSQGYYLVSTLFWSNCALPYLFCNFYLNRPIEERTSKLRLFSLLMVLYMLESLIEGLLFFSLMVFNLLHTYIHAKKQFDIVHVNQLIKLVLLLAVTVIALFRYCFLYDQTFFSQHTLNYLLSTMFHVLLLTLAMLTTRIIAIRYIKQELYRYFYTETSINCAFIAVTFCLNLLYLDSFHRSQGEIFAEVIINLIFLGCIGAVIYLQGRQRLVVVMDADLEQQA